MKDIRKTRLEWGSEIGPFEIQNYPDFRSQKVMLQGLDHLKISPLFKWHLNTRPKMSTSFLKCFWTPVEKQF